MPDHFINLNCANCGAKLEVHDDMGRFACGYCGTEMLVQRRGGTVALHAVTEAIKNVQVGTDKTAAELAIARYETELKQLQGNAAKLANDESTRSCTGIGCLGMLLLVGLATISSDAGSGIGWFLVLACTGAAAFMFFKKREGNSQLEDVRQRIRQLENQIAEKKRIADS